MAATAPQCGSQQGGTVLPAATEGPDQSGSNSASDSRGWGVRRSSNAGRDAAQLCEICMEFSSELRCSGSCFTASSCIRRQSEGIAPTGMDRALEITATSRPGPTLGPCIQARLAGSAWLGTPRRLGFQVDLTRGNYVTNATWIHNH